MTSQPTCRQCIFCRRKGPCPRSYFFKRWCNCLPSFVQVQTLLPLRGPTSSTTLAMSASTSFKTIAQWAGSLRSRWARLTPLKPSGARKMSRLVPVLAASGVVAMSAGYCARQANTRMYLVQDAANVPGKTVSIQRTEEQHSTRL